MTLLQTALRTPSFGIAILGYALFLVINACSLWGGVFPFFPQEFHSEQVTFTFMMAQSLASFFTSIAICICSFQMPSIVTKSLHGVSSFPAFLGGMLLIVALYLPEWRVFFVAIAGFCMGTGGSLLSLMWARYFSAESTERGNFAILSGTFLAPLLFGILHFVPPAVRVFLVPLLFVPLCGLAVLLSFRNLDKTLPLFQDAPRTNAPVYARIARVYWKSAFAIGTLGFASGLVRAITVSDIHLGDITNIASFSGLFVIAGLLLLLWKYRSFTLNLRFVFMISFPLVALCLAFFPFIEGLALAFISSIVFLLFSLANIVVMLQSAHICLNRGCNPFFVYGFFGSIIGLLQNSGFIFGHIAVANQLFGEHTSFAMSVIGLLVLTITLYAFVGKSGLFTSNLPQYDNVEFISFNEKAVRVRQSRLLALLALPETPEEGNNSANSANNIVSNAASNSAATLHDNAAPPNVTAVRNVTTPCCVTTPNNVAALNSMQKEASFSSEQDCDTFSEEMYQLPQKAPSRITVRCKILQGQYRLTSRETEVMELIVRGYSVAQIAEKHVVSENTVRTHYKHIYAKLGIHKKQELIAMVDALKK